MATHTPDHSLDEQSLSGLMIGLAITFTSLNTIVVIARIYTRAIRMHNFGVDDVFILITLTLAIGLNTTTILEAHFGVGRHTWLATPEAIIAQLKCLFSAIQLYIWSLCFVKLSLLLQYRRIFPAPWLQRVSLVIMVFACTWNVVQSILVSFACDPMEVINPALAGKCLDSLTIWYIAAGFNIATDFVVWLLPIPLIQSLQLPLRQKILLCMIFGIGLFTCVISIVRATTLREATGTVDPSWFGTFPAIWSMAEVNLAILCSCLPTIRFLVHQVLPCLGLRNQASKYLGLPYRHSKESKNSAHRPSFKLRFQKSEPGNLSRIRRMRKTIGSSFDSTTRPEPVANPADLLESRSRGGAINHEKPGLYYHSNQISAWVSANPGKKSPTKSELPTTSPTEPHTISPTKPDAPSDDADSEKQLVDRRPTDKDLGQQILATSTMTVKEGGAEGSLKS